MFVREIPVDAAIVKLKAQMARWRILTALMLAGFGSTVYLFISDIMWSWDGLDPFVGERTPEGLIISIITSVLEMTPAILESAGVIKKKSTEYYVLWTIAGVAYFIDITTNYFGLSVRHGQSAWGWQSDNAIATIVKVALSIVIGFMEAIMFWVYEGFSICWESWKAIKSQLAQVQTA